MKAIPIHPQPVAIGGAALQHTTLASRRNLLLAPHRIAFFGGTVMLLLGVLAWAALLVARQAGLTVELVLPPTLLHGIVFAGGCMPLFMAGFMYTAGPRWLEVQAPSARSLHGPVVMHCAGVVLIVLGACIHPAVAAFGALLLAMAWTAVGVGFAGLIRAGEARDKLHAKCVMTFWSVGIGCALLFAAGLAIRHPGSVAAAVWLMVFGFVAPIYGTVGHRVLPFFTSTAVTRFVPWRPNWALALLLASMLLFGAVQSAARLDLLPARQLASITVWTVGPAALALALLALRWGRLQSLRGPSLRLLAMLHLGFVWSVLALVLATADAAFVLLASSPAPRLGLAPLHALTMGFFGSLLFAMATRVICGHGGIPVVADRAVWSLFWVLQLAVLLRVAGSAWPPHAAPLSVAAVLLWSAVWIAWAIRYLPVLLRPPLARRPA